MLLAGVFVSSTGHAESVGSAAARDDGAPRLPPAATAETRGVPEPREPACGAQALECDDAQAAPEQQPLAIAASVVPGVLLHGTGSWVLGERDAAARLFLYEGIGVGTVLVSGTGLALTGAARATIAPLALLAIAGVSLVSVAFLSDVYNVTAPDSGWGRARASVPRLQTQLGYVYVVDPIFAYSHLVTHGLELRPGAFLLHYQAWHAPLAGHARLRAAAGYRFWGKTSADARFVDGSFSELELGFVHQRFDTLGGDDGASGAGGFDVNGAEVQLRSRLDSQRVVPQVNGAFFDFDAGIGLRRTTFRELPGVQTESVLLARTGFGFYLGHSEEPSKPWGEVELYYDHRHDDLAAGMKVGGLGSGVAGHIGTSLLLDLTSSFGVQAFSEFGSAWVSGVSLRVVDAGRW